MQTYNKWEKKESAKLVKLLLYMSCGRMMLNLFLIFNFFAK